LLGRFLEISVLAADAHAGWELFQRAGFVPAQTGDIWSHPYGVACCSGLAIGLHAQGEALSLCTVRPNVIELHRELEDMGVAIESAQLGQDAFNQLTLREPSGIALRVLEARTFAPPAESPVRTLLGRFDVLSLPAPNLDATAGFWGRLGYDTHETASPLGGIEIESGLPLGFHPVGSFPDPVLVFRGDGVQPEIAALLACGLDKGKPLPALAGVDHHLLGGPGGIRLLLLA
jgi:hypothetical protein